MGYTAQEKQTLFDDRVEQKTLVTKKERRSTPHCLSSEVPLAKVKEQPKKRSQDHIVQVGHDKQTEPAADQPPHLVAAVAANVIAKHIRQLAVPYDNAAANDQDECTDEERSPTKCILHNI